jgi:putative transposase
VGEKKLPPSCDWKRRQVEPDHETLSVRRQCELVGLNRSSFYLEPASASEIDLSLMEQLDRLHLDHPELGSRKLAVLLS